MTGSVRLCRAFVALSATVLLTGCTALHNPFEPAPTDPNDGYEGSLAQAGVNTEMDWGPKQELLLSEYKTLREEHQQIQRRLETVLAENQNLKTRLNDEQEAHGQEQALRAQIEAQLDLRNQKLGEQEATILSLRIEKAKAEQAALLAQMDVLRATMDQLTPANVEASAVPPAGR
ncbi:MAG: hypothetical protein KDE27_20135 [Planctomycetes bacterium]|nr:hypothetical protein [Planctomycetota bacterium]